MSERIYRGNMISIIASAFILVELILVLINGLQYLFSTTSKLLMWIIFILALPSYITYSRSNLKKSFFMRVFGALAIVIAFAGLILIQLNQFIGIETLILGYMFEPLAGISIYLSLYNVNKLFSSLFFYGALIYTIGLPMYLINLGIVSVAGDVIKMIGLFMLIMSFYTKRRVL
ncbi:hypothetical protein [Sulfolobus acidocaldarius]|uniref:Conserved Crenarchaeal membrane protein n=5 Tax=Sulfolobus acidocaldarius TaxID=2285 RepID=Q4J6L5_SULAC|nr:hypothetical protein [Sulfolobus acidocaldarius]AAY81566.1 conserved Crenarchaeal membrane protein [Sulfolobus acidocaldarius DSM 639]AGE72169.1 hypothetical protein SacN8_11115 [Sulfolobus acidocaldarius N8]AGE74486.1 hypothetical protein SacRon12I_11360 [Sulfolobus acidocaldarius Ron12/I]ALU32394.1 hypothetical protein ATZ20_09725 [Sulfolobus acidocaldarius]WCM33938.1 hypothetical protein GO597_00560 [Sulfolobus acidocaldarius DSM 639]